MLKAKLKSVLRPIVKHRKLLERMKYCGTPILCDQAGNDRIAQMLQSGIPAAVAKMGSVELGGLRQYESRKNSSGICTDWGRHAKLLFNNAGVFPETAEAFSSFCREYSQALGELDLLGVWFNFGENSIRRAFAPHAEVTGLRALEPYYHERPWSQHLSGKRVLVISPFVETIAAQLPRRLQIWQKKPDVLPEIELELIKTPLSAGLVPPVHPDWTSALNALRRQMENKSFDVAIVGCGAWSMPLVVHAKQLGKFGIHLGGATQLLFGVRGRRWDEHPQIAPLFNASWIRPNDVERPQTFTKVEEGCYW